MALLLSDSATIGVQDKKFETVKVALLEGGGAAFYCPRGFADGKNDRKRLLKSLESIFIL